MVLLLTEWSEYVALDPVELGALVACRGCSTAATCLDPDAWRAAGWTYRALGRP